MGRFATMSLERDTVSLWLDYHDGNLRIQRAGWDNPTAQPARIRIWDAGALVHDDTYLGTGTRNIPGNHQLRSVPNELTGGTSLALPEGITYRMDWPAPGDI